MVREHRFFVSAVVFLTVMLIAPVTGVRAAGPYQSSNFEVEGDVHSVGDPRPQVAGATGSFVLENLTKANGDIGGAIDDDGRVTIDTQPTTKYYADTNGDGAHEASSLEQTVVPGGDPVFVSGRYQRVEGELILVASYVFSPPPQNVGGPSVANPEPELPRDAVINRVYGLRGDLHNPSATLTKSIARSKFFGFELKNIQTGCSSSYCHIDTIAAAHGGALGFTETSLTKYWVRGADGNYRRTSDRYQAIESRGIGADMLVTGRYQWDGTDWRFFASHVFSPPPDGSGSTQPGPVGPYDGTVVENSQGTEDATTGGRIGSEWNGTIHTNGPLGGANIYMNLDWYEGTDGVWTFTGSYSVLTVEAQPTGFEGEVSGTITPGAIGTLDADLTIVEAYGRFAGYEGAGSWEGGATFAPDGRPVHTNGSFLWEVVAT